MKILTVVGARPQFVKAASVSREVRSRPALQEVLVHTGQHFDAAMSAVFFSELGIPEPDHHLGVAGGGHGAMTGRMMERMEAVMASERPDCVVVYGDTNSTLAGAIVAAKLHVPVAHVEAGLRSWNRRMPEEVNRILADHASDVLLTPTNAATANLLREGIATERIRQVGDVMYDAALYYAQEASRRSTILDRLGLRGREYVLATVHRAENTDEGARLQAILEGLAVVARRMPVVLPLHPRTRKALERGSAAFAAAEQLELIDPVGYLDMVMLERDARLVATDSGGVQKEAFFFEVPCVTLRDETEWIELVELGWNRLVSPGGGADAIAEAVLGALDMRGVDARPYGEGTAAAAIVDALLELR